MIIFIYEIHTETMTCLLSYHDSLVEPLLGHSIGPTLLIFGSPHASSFERHLLICGFDSAVDLDDWDHVFDDDDLRLFDFLIYHTSDVILGHISVLVEICISPLICMTIPSYEIHVGLRIHFHSILIP